MTHYPTAIKNAKRRVRKVGIQRDAAKLEVKLARARLAEALKDLEGKKFAHSLSVNLLTLLVQMEEADDE